jgi:PAS domain S-box-containing protein
METLNVLLVDDEPETADMIKFALSRKAPGYSMTAVDSGPACLEYLKSHNVDCILSDYQMPGMDGLQLLKTIRKQHNEVPFIFVTGQGNEEVAREAFREGANDYFTKEIGFAHFTRIVNSIRQSVKQRLAHEAAARAETEVSLQKQDWEETFNAISDSVAIIDLDFNIVRANRYTCDFLGMEPEELCGKKCYELFHGTTEPMASCPAKGLIQRYITNRENGQLEKSLPPFEHEIPVKDRVLDVTVYPLTKDGDLRALVHTARDITERKHAEQSVEKARDMMALILESVQFGMMVVGKDRRIRRVNRAALEMAGFENEGEIVGRLCHETICPAEVGKCPVIDLGMKMDMSERTMVGSKGDSISILKSVSTVTLGDEEVLLETFVRKNAIFH